MEALSCLPRRTREGSYLSGFKVKDKDGERLEVSHLLFADEALVFVRSPKLKDLFKLVTYKINLSKSNLILVGMVENLEDLAFVLGYEMGDLPSTYLDLPLGVPSNSLTIWDGVKKRFHKRLAMWKRQYFQRGGAHTNLEHFI